MLSSFAHVLPVLVTCPCKTSAVDTMMSVTRDLCGCGPARKWRMRRFRSFFGDEQLSLRMMTSTRAHRSWHRAPSRGMQTPAPTVYIVAAAVMEFVAEVIEHGVSTHAAPAISA